VLLAWIKIDRYIMNSTQEQLRFKFQQALFAAFGADYAEIDPCWCLLVILNLVIISQI
jgi:hypothetical protein